MSRSRKLRYIVTGPGLEKEPSYESAGAALSRTITEASRVTGVATFYVRGSVLGAILGYSEKDEHGTIRVGEDMNNQTERSSKMERISDRDLAELCDRNGFPSVGSRLAAGESQEEATAYMVGMKIGDEDNGYPFDDTESAWLKCYVETLHS